MSITIIDIMSRNSTSVSPGSTRILSLTKGTDFLRYFRLFHELLKLALVDHCLSPFDPHDKRRGLGQLPEKALDRENVFMGEIG